MTESPTSANRRSFSAPKTSGLPGPAALRVVAGPTGVESVVPGILGVNILNPLNRVKDIAGPAEKCSDAVGRGTIAPCFTTPCGHRVNALRSAVKIDDDGAGRTWSVEHGGLTGTWRIEPNDAGFTVEYKFIVLKSIRKLSVISVPVDSRGGLLWLPGREEAFDPDDCRSAGESIDLTLLDGVEATPAFSLGSQGGFLARLLESSTPVDRVEVERLSEIDWHVGLGFDAPAEGSEISGRVEFQVIPFNGAVGLKRVIEVVDIAVGASKKSSAAGEIDREIEADGVAEIDLEVDGQKLTLRALNGGDPIPVAALEACKVGLGKRELGDREVNEITLTLKAVRALPDVRFEADLETPCANPTWHGDSTIFIPGNFARCNYHPDHLHGGGPKWGPSPTPVVEAKVTNDDAPGQCHGWTFAASRLPQVWTSAIDKDAGRQVWLAATPRSPLGENCAGFVSPEGETTTLKLATPTTYEPWVPLGYSRMRPQERRDTAGLEAGEEVVWTVWIAVEETKDLNAWGALDRALYNELRVDQPAPLKLSRDEAARVCAAAIYDKFYLPEQKSVRYSTGPEGLHSLVGFTGMSHSALVMLWAGMAFGEEQWREAGTAVLDKCAEMFLEGPGFPWTFNSNRENSGGEVVEGYKAGSGEPGYVTMCAFDNLAEAYRRERSAGREHKQWAAALKRCADHWVKNQSSSGAYPHWGPDWSPEFTENEYEVTNIEVGAIANVLDAYELFDDQKYLTSALVAGEHYARDLDAGRLWGGPGDIRALVNSEVPMFFLRAYRRLYEVTRDEEHKRLMLVSADWRYSFQFAHSWAVDPGTPLWIQGWAGLGSENASACNLHSVAFGCVNVPDEWALYKLTGDDYHRRRCEDLARYSAQQYARFEGDVGFPFAGAGTESWWTSDTLWGKGRPWIFTNPGFDLGFMSWVTGWSGYGALWAKEIGIDF